MRFYFSAYKNSIYLLMAFSLVIIFNGCAGSKPGPEDKAARIKAGTEMFIAKDVTNVPPFWCGQGPALVYEVEDEGFFVHDIETGRKFNIGGANESPVACTPDGGWIVYRDKESYRAVKGTEEEDAVVDLWRYEFETKRRQRFAIVGETEVPVFNEAVFSTTGLKLYLGKKVAEGIEMPEPVWEVVWSEGRKSNGEVLFADSSALLGTYAERVPREGGYVSSTDVLEVEVFEPERKLMTIYPGLEIFNLLLSDSQNRVYIRVQGSEVDGRVIERCELDLEGETISCLPVLKSEYGLCPRCQAPDVPKSYGISGFDVFDDDETMVFTMKDDTCVRIMRVGEKEALCLTTPAYEVGFYVTISPDQRWAAFTVFGKREGIGAWGVDLYVVRLEKY